MKIIYLSVVLLGVSMGKGDKSSSDEMRFCTMEVKSCPDGSFVGRDSKNNCEFHPCPEMKGCPEDAKLCPDGTSLVRDPKKGCDFPACPSEKK